MMSDDFFDQMMKIMASGDLKGAADVDEAVFRELMQDFPVPVQPVREPVRMQESSRPAAVAAASRNVPPEPSRRVEDVPAAPEVPAAVVSAAGMDWAALQDAVANCRNCGLCQARNHTVFGEGNIHAELMFIGEGPGADEDAAGRPFVGRAGQLLTKMIAAMTYTREEVYIANVVKCRPPGNRNPAPEEAMACLGYLKQQIALIRPKVIVCLGGVALSFLCQQAGGITRARGHWLDFEGIPVMPTFHPAFLLRQESAKKEVWSDLQQVMRALGRTRK